ncbi:hypothetical protein [Demequina lignilytica]|uniref:DUF3592 domain-containing protein n=1 Tax=Demequina lignilytica TaxID=3051663 RepID=A0AB35MKX5_9MICO|nr:hypothetical protein [Demequina sp. SYSU T0a273]MDN4484499.1 hypothetical protein [Demequina sp. SYSU T0a273]
MEGSKTRSPARKAGIVLVVVGALLLGLSLIGHGYAALFYDTPSPNSLVNEVTDLSDGRGDPCLQIGRDNRGTVIWEGTCEEWDLMNAEAIAMNQDEFRGGIIPVSTAGTVAGIVILVVGVVLVRRTR